MRASDAYMIPFSLLWGGFAIVWESTVVFGDAPFFAMLWGTPFVLLGLYMMIGRFFVDARQRSKTYYGVTDERIIIVSGLLSRNVKSLNLRTLTDVSLDEKSNGSGIISFGAMNPMSRWYGGVSLPGWGNLATPAFDLPAEAKTVYEIIRNAQCQST